MRKDDVVRKAKALLRLNEKAGTVAEAEAAMRKVRSLLAKYDLSFAELDWQKNNIAEKSPWKYTEQLFKQKSRWEVYERTVLSSVAVLTNTLILEESRSNYSAAPKVCLLYVGDETDVAVAVALAPVLLNTQRRTARAFAGKGWGPEHRYHALGFAGKIYQRSKRLKNEPPDGWSPESCRALIQVEYAKFNWVQQTMQERNPATEKIIRPELKISFEHLGAFEKGMEDGKKVDLGTKNKLAGGD